VADICQSCFFEMFSTPQHKASVHNRGAKYLVSPGALEEIVRAAVARNAALALGVVGWVVRAERFLCEG
jgi:hypothetical protein